MRRLRRNIRKIIYISLFVICCVYFVEEEACAQTYDYKEQYQKALAYEEEYVKREGLDDWSVFTLSRADALTEQQKKDYLEDLKKLLEESQGVLSRNRSTEYSRRVLTVTALGIDANDVYGYSLLEPLACYDFTVQQGIYGGIYALLALDSGNYEFMEIPEGYTKTTRDNLVAFLLKRQLADGGWTVSGRYADADTTASVIAALTPYYNRNDVKEALDRAASKLSGMMGSTGGYASYGAVNAESTAQVLVAMATMGIPLGHADYVKEGNTILDGLFSFQLADGSFEHIKGGGFHQMATEQALYAMVALKRQQDGKAPLYQMTDVKRDTSISQQKQSINLDELWKDFKEDKEAEEEQTQPRQDEELQVGENQKPQTKKEDEENNTEGKLQTIPDINSVMNSQTELGKALLKTPAGWEAPRKDNKKQKRSDTRGSGTTITLDIKPLLKNASHSSKKQQAKKIEEKNTKKGNVKKETLFLFPSKKQEEIGLLVEQGVSFTVKKKGFSAPYLLEQEVSLEDGDYVFCRYVDANTKPEALAKVWVKKGMLSVTIKEPGHYFVGKRVRNCSVSELRMQQAELANVQSKEDMAESREMVSGKVDTIEKSEDKKKPEREGVIWKYFWIALFLIVQTMIGCGLTWRNGKKK